MNIQQMISRVSFFLLVSCTLAVAPTVAQTFTHVPLFPIDGPSTVDNFGGSASGAGDVNGDGFDDMICLLYTSPSPRDGLLSRMPSSA